MGATRGIHVIWTTYGTWLPGDPNKPGHWSPLFDLYGRVQRAGHQLNMPDARAYAHARSLMKEPPKTLVDEEPRIVADIVGEQLAPGMPGDVWRIYAGAIEPTHVHLLFGPLRDNISDVVGRIKSRTSSVLLQHTMNRARSRTWTAGYWKVFLFDSSAVDAVSQYIEGHNTRRGLPAVPFDWITPIRVPST